MDILDAAPAQFPVEVSARHLRDFGSGALGYQAPDEPVDGQQKANLLGEFAGRREDPGAQVIGELERDGRHAAHYTGTKALCDAGSQRRPLDLRVRECTSLPQNKETRRREAPGLLKLSRRGRRFIIRSCEPPGYWCDAADRSGAKRVVESLSEL